MRGLEFFLRETFASIVRHGLMSLAAVSTVMVGLTILGALALTVVNLNLWADHLAHKVEVMVPLRDGLKPDGVKRLQTRIRHLPNVRDVQFVSRQEGLHQLERDFGRDYFADLGFNPLFDSFKVQVVEPDDVSHVAAAIRQLEGVDAKNVDYGEKVLAERIFALRRAVWAVGLGATGVLAIAILLIVSNAIRLTVFARRQEIRIMRLVGATNSFIRTPFLLEGFFHGAVGAGVSCGVLVVGYTSCVRSLKIALPYLPLAGGSGLLLPFCGALLLTGAAFGFAASLISTRRFLAHI